MPIPKIIHQTWKTTELPEHWKESHEKWKEFGWEYILWTDEMNRSLIETDFPWFLKTYDSYKYGIQRADAIRYFILYKYGGIYCDLDLVPTPFFKTLFEGTYHQLNGIVLAESSSDFRIRTELFTNALMMSEAKCDFWPIVWDMLQTPVSDRKGALRGFMSDSFHYFNVLFTTGPGVINDAFNKYKEKTKVYVLPSSFVYPTKVDSTAMGIEPAIISRQGSSWHNKGDKFWGGAQAAWKVRDYYLIPMAVLAIILVVTMIILAARGKIH